ncbi:hypothetical protein ACFWFV_14060 [Streptomyces diastaticus]|uniref:hypothetical protein n=1 Tax=Streptomyces TaxID=1883 RepID=UPI0013BD9C5F|nr:MULTISPECIES: hypothetical protein [unclassified Streptomyces]MBL3808517.1 hypothetical protein [Streptomyces sp. BRB081]NEC14813.1 hypothetical protein [Streptomyces sp. SID8014]
MSFGWHRDTIVRVRAPMATDPYGNPRRDWANAERTPMPGWRVQPVQGARQTAAETIPREGLERSRRLFGPISADIESTDRIEWQGEVWVIDGDVDRWRGPTGRLAHTELLMQRMEG